MGAAREIILRPISSRRANDFVRREHYSGKVAPNSQLHIGVFWHGRLEGALQFGPSIAKRQMLGLVGGTGLSGFLELNRMVFTDRLPRNSESRAIGIAMRLLRKHKPGVKWVVSFADATACGDGTIYRAAGFVLTDIRPDRSIAIDSNGVTHHKMRYESNPLGTNYFRLTGGRYDWRGFVKARGWTPAVGWQLRYIYFLDPTARERLTVPIIPFSEIQRRGAGMYRGKPRAGSIGGDAAVNQAVEGGSTPTSALVEAK